LLEQDPENVRYRLLRSAARLRLNEIDEALVDVEAVLRQPDPPPRAWTVRGWLRLFRDQPQQAQADFERALGDMPQHVAALIGVAQAHELQAEYETALATFELARRNAITDYQTAAAELGRCRCLVRLGRLDEAKDAVVAARRAKPFCETDSVIQVADAVGAADFVAEVKQQTAPRSVVERFARTPPHFSSAPLLNAGFELGLSRHWNNDQLGGLAWHNVGGAVSSADVDPDQSHGGDLALHIVHQSEPATDAYGTTSQIIPLDPEVKYRITLWARSIQATENAVGVVIGDRIAAPVVALPAGAYEWTEFSGEFDVDHDQAVREGVAQVGVRIVSTGPCEVWLDDVRIERIDGATDDASDSTADSSDSPE